jgi:hypothetical protein
MAIPLDQKPFANLMLVYALWTLGGALAGSLFEVYFLGTGMTITEIYLADAFWFVAALVMVPLLARMRARDFMLAGVAMAMLSTSVLIAFQGAWTAAAFRLLLGTTHLLFWAPLNIMFYEFRKGNNALLGAIYYSVGPVLSLFTPALAGVLAVSFGFPALFIAAFVVFALTFAATLAFIPNREYSYDFISGLKSIHGLRSLVFIEGFTAMVIVGVSLPVMLLLFIDTPAEFGYFTSLVTVFSLAAAVVTARLSDKVKKRRSFLLPVAAGFAIASILAGLSPTVAIFFITFGLVGFFSRIFFPLPFALAVDNTKSLTDTMLGREYMLNLGRLAGTLLGFFIVAFADIRMAIVVQGVLMLLYVPIFERKKARLESH